LLAHFEVRKLAEAWVAREGQRGKRETKGFPEIHFLNRVFVKLRSA